MIINIFYSQFTSKALWKRVKSSQNLDRLGNPKSCFDLSFFEKSILDFVGKILIKSQELTETAKDCVFEMEEKTKGEPIEF